MPSREPRIQAAFLALALGAASGAAGVAHVGRAEAQCAEEAARKVFEAGKQYYDTGYYEDALKSFRRAHDMCAKPGLLKNIGATEERLGNLAAAIEAYEQYVKAAPAAEDRDATLLLIANLKKRVVAPAPSASAPASAPVSPPATPPAPPPSPPASSASVVPPPPPPPASPAGVNRVPAYVSFGVAGAAALGAVITGLVAKSRYDTANSNCAPRCADSEVSGVKSMALISTILSGVAVVGVGVGGVFLLTARPSDAASANGPRATVGLLPGGGAFTAGWSFR